MFIFFRKKHESTKKAEPTKTKSKVDMESLFPESSEIYDESLLEFWDWDFGWRDKCCHTCFECQMKDYYEGYCYKKGEDVFRDEWCPDWN